MWPAPHTQYDSQHQSTEPHQPGTNWQAVDSEYMSDVRTAMASDSWCRSDMMSRMRFQ